MKKLLIFAVVLSLLLPAAAFAATEFSLGGFIKLDAFWDSTQAGKNLNGGVARDNDPNFHHGQMRYTAQGSRFNFTIKGPKVFGAQVTGFIEMDFDGQNATTATGFAPAAAGNVTLAPYNDVGSSSVYTPRLRHAMFRFNWPETELLLGQYWSMFCEWYIESAEDGPLQATGTPTARIPQIRLTQTFLGDWMVAGLIGNPNSAILPGTNAAAINSTSPYSVNANNGMAAETPQIQGKIRYAHDWWGKAPYYGAPTPFTAQVVAGWQRNIVRTNAAITGTGITAPGTAVTFSLPNQFVAPWMVMGTLFIPVIPTHSANLAGTAHILTQWWIGQGVEAYGFTGSSAAVLHLSDAFSWDVSPLKRWGGLAEAQYYFDNQWFINAAYAITKVYGVRQGFNVDGDFLTTTSGLTGVNAQLNAMQQVDATLWYRPIQAIKFGLQYSYAHTTFMTRINGAGGFAANTDLSNKGDEHRVEFAGFFFF